MRSTSPPTCSPWRRRCCGEIDPTPGVRLLGLSGSNLGPPLRQLSFDDVVAARCEDAGTSRRAPADWESATEAMDAIRDRFGTTAIGPASALEAGRLRVVRPGAQQWGPDQGQRPIRRFLSDLGRVEEWPSNVR